MKHINYIRLAVLASLPAFPIGDLQGQGLHLTPGINWVTNGSPNLILNNAGLTNDGHFNADSSTVQFTGDGLTSGSFIGGENAVAFYNLAVNKSSNDLQLNGNTMVTGTVILNNGNLQLNNYTLDLGSSGTISGERDSSCITGIRGGAIQIMAMLNGPHAVNPGNIGVELTSEANLGMTIITRGHVQQTNSDGTTSIQRWFDIVPQTNTNLHASLRLFYLDGELAGKDKGELSVFSNSDGSAYWSLWGKDGSDAGANWISANNIDQLHRFTLAIGADKLPSKSIDAIAAVQVYPNPSHNEFTAQIMRDKEGSGNIRLYDQSGQILEERSVYWQAGVNAIYWNISKYAAGVYYLAVGNQLGKTVKIVKQ